MTVKNKFGKVGSVLFLLVLLLCGCQTAESTETSVTTGVIHFVDDDGRTIDLDKPCEKIISLYSAHTENLYTLGAGEKIIGVHQTSIYPPEAAFKPIYDYNADPEKIIAAEPDLVLIRPFITGKAPDFVKAIENAGITVVSLYPETLAGFDDYIEKLALLTGTEAKAEIELAAFHQNLADIAAITDTIAVKQKVFFEATEVDLRTVTVDSMAGQAIILAGGENIAADARAVKAGSSIAAFGIERILALAEEIDVYVSQRGAMNAGGNEHAIRIRPGFETVKAIQNNRIYLINEKIISSPTFRYDKGVREMARFLYPEIFDDLSEYQNDVLATKTDLANIIVKGMHLPLYVTSSSKYYQQDHKGHIYGLFADVLWSDKDFDAIETVVQAGYVDWRKEGEKQYYDPQEPVTRETLARTIFLLGTFSYQESSVAIKDLDACQTPRIVQTLVDNGVFTLQNGAFLPDKVVSQREIIEALAFIQR